MRKKIVILGITGSIGKSALDVIRKHSDKYKIVLASSHNRYEDLLKISDEFNIPKIAVTNAIYQRKINTDKQIYFGEDELLLVLDNLDYDILLNAVVGSAGLKYTLSGVRSEKIIALANKESLVMSGDIIDKLISQNNAKLIPVDSEHSAIMQCLLGVKDSAEIRKIILTASGGPFRNRPFEDFESITLADTLNHPTWNMGNKITVDSATMANKGLEVIEAHHLFKLPFEQIETIIHPQSIIHSFVEFVDGSILSQLSFPDMKIPIQLALSYPERIPATAKFTDISLLPDLTFEKMDYQKFPLLEIAYEVGKAGGIMPTVFNAANEAAVSLFLNGKIHFTEIMKIIETSLDISNILDPDIETILSINEEIKLKIFSQFQL
ncbi:MAG: 1-deoxy-D-xylulose-5-phosphate reductoisomerase [Candidatus Cloacimonadota bacterium]|nr:1-deoxy-D-xylulose-5-phosphate reductoisomerase [Candidatus Cloacimonadota bacterium]